jgi:hypothetical protein
VTDIVDLPEHDALRAFRSRSHDGDDDECANWRSITCGPWIGQHTESAGARSLPSRSREYTLGNKVFTVPGLWNDPEKGPKSGLAPIELTGRRDGLLGTGGQPKSVRGPLRLRTTASRSFGSSSGRARATPRRAAGRSRPTTTSMYSVYRARFPAAVPSGRARRSFPPTRRRASPSRTRSESSVSRTLDVGRDRHRSRRSLHRWLVTD